MIGEFWSAHSHSKYSAVDALPDVERVVDRAEELGYPALGLTDHGNMAGAARLYTACRAVGIKPVPGVEAYVHLNRGASRKAMHLGLLATSAVGYRNLVGLVTQSHKQFWYRPQLDIGDFAEAARDGRLEGIAAMSGCHFGLLPTQLREGAGDGKQIRNLLASLDSWFGSGLYVELQHHKVPGQDDAANVARLHGIAQSMGLPVIITQDSHYCHPSEREQHDTMKGLGSWSDDPDSALFPGDGYHMVDAEWMRGRYTAQQFSDGMAGLDHLQSIANVVIPELDTYRLAVPDTGGDPDVVLRASVERGLVEQIVAGRVKKSNVPLYRARIEEEMDVVTNAGFSGYLLLTQTVCDYMRSADIFFSVRGSASGSLLCWLIGVTSLDSLAWGLPFDRFLSRDRTKPPDIDLDIEHRRREEVIDWIGERHHTVRIGRWVEMGLSREDGEDEKGALLVKWKMLQRKLGRDPTIRPSPAEMMKLQALAAHKPFGAYGVHPAGLMITPDEATAACVPLMHSTAGKVMITQFEMDDIERLGLVKLDLLSGQTMTALKIALSATGVDETTIPFNDAATYTMLRNKQTTGLFQLEGRAFARGMRQLQPKKFTDLIAAMALFRPQAMGAGAVDKFIDRRNGKEAIPKRHRIIADETAETYGVVLYQEQVLNIMKKIGLTMEEIERARKAIKASNDKVASARQTLEELQGKITVKAGEAGMSPEDVAWLKEAVAASAEYGFNKAHSTSYAVIAYTTAYMRRHHPVEFWLGMLDAYSDSSDKTWYGVGAARSHMKKTEAYALAAQADGVTILPAHVNKSGHSWTLDSRLNAVRAGLTSIPMVADTAAAELVAHQPYANLDDLALRVSGKRVTGAKDLGQGHSPKSCGGVIAALDAANALSGLDRDPVAVARLEAARLAKEEKAADLLFRKTEEAYKELAKDQISAVFTAMDVTVKKNARYHDLVRSVVGMHMAPDPVEHPLGINDADVDIYVKAWLEEAP